MSAFLPQRDPCSLMRQAPLAAARMLYQYNYSHVSSLALIDTVPIKDEFSFRWLAKVAERVVAALANRAELEFGAREAAAGADRKSRLEGLISLGESAVAGIREIVMEALHFDGQFGASVRHANNWQDFADLYRTIGLPPVAKDFTRDESFAKMRVAGPNPVVIRRLMARDERLPVTDAQFASVVAGDSLDSAIAEARAYLVDYSMLDGAETGSFPHGQKYLYAPLALLVVDRVTRKLCPVAIQCQQQPGPDNPVFTPADGHDWLIAKLVVETADGNLHEASTHLGRTHLAMEPFALATFRQLAACHPLHVLLEPHFEGTFAINREAWRHLIADRGAVEQLFGASIQAARGVAVQSVQSLRVTEALLPQTFAARGVDDVTALPDYAYRDDSLLYWSAIREWVEAYCRAYYLTDDDVVADAELQAWGRELASRDGGRIGGLPHQGAFQQVPELVDVLTFIIFTCSVQHAAVNFPQYDVMSYAPAMPLGLYRPAPTQKGRSTEADVLAMLPTLDMAELQLELGYMLGTVHYTQLGDYGFFRFRDRPVRDALRRFQQRLDDIGDRIAERNLERTPYETLSPHGIPQSINI